MKISTTNGLHYAVYQLVSPSHGLLGHTSVITHSMPTTGAPIHQPVCQVPKSLKDTVKAEVKPYSRVKCYQT